MSDQEIQELDYQTVRRRVVRRFIKRLLFAANALLWLAYIASEGPYFYHGELGGVITWLLLLIVHFVYAFEIWGRIVDRMTQREIENLQRKGYRVTPPIYPSSREAPQRTKQKREQVARLSDDGEIVYEEPPQAAESSRAAARRSK